MPNSDMYTPPEASSDLSSSRVLVKLSLNRPESNSRARRYVLLVL